MKVIQFLFIIISCHSYGQIDCASKDTTFHEEEIIAKLWYYKSWKSEENSLYPNQEIKNPNFDAGSPFICAYSNKADSLIVFNVKEYTFIVKDSLNQVIYRENVIGKNLTITIKLKIRNNPFNSLFLTNVTVCGKNGFIELREEYPLIQKQ
ncbi:hypothetical protein K6119_04075 [Paracrocinitomix mangrovi]|uniref:hypothetical protein n=1 Tax=Paracrocinitomix mangrovi TaxID=2862509 RepID=UPI001C8EB3A8|nr:hypothetical protein [Paracrocinitomix mangrovi]UKN02690.1 hypothetical protein K6119_04075 [Paracrocinitomix mangrovi]